MVEYVFNDLFDQEADYLMEQKNCFHIHGGLSGIMAQRYPKAAAADLRTPKGDLNKLGTCQIVDCGDVKVINAYAQFSVGGRATDYDAWERILAGLREYFDSIPQSLSSRVTTIKCPARLGSGLGGGDFSVMHDIFEKHFGDSKKIIILFCVRGEDRDWFDEFRKIKKVKIIQ